MCGFAGFVDFAGRPAAEWLPVLEQLHRAIQHRGPDSWGRVILEGGTIREWSARGESSRARSRAHGPTVGLTHARLSIIDLTPAGHQPMAAAGEAGWIAYNGEIYNYRTLRDGLVAQGVCFRGGSDTEVMASLVAAEGPDAIEQMRGNFAFAWWDERAGRLVLARDRFGMKPLVWGSPAADVVFFASEPRALMMTGRFAPSLRPDRVAEFFARGSVDAAASVWEDVRAVGPGSYEEIDESGARSRTYWSLDDALLEPGPEAPAADVARTTHVALVDSVKAHLVSDVPVAIFLSGGLDSTALLAAAREITDGPVRTFTVALPGSGLDESAHARATAAHFRSEHLEVSIEDVDIDAALDEFFGVMQTPSVDGFNTFLVARAARGAGVKVALSGAGGDELLGGYDSFVGVPRVARLLSTLGPAARPASRLLHQLPASRAAKLAAILAGRPAGTGRVWWEYRRLFDDQDVQALANHAAAAPPPLPGDELPAFTTIRLLETRHFLESQLLADADAFTMCGALELRTPFVDHELARAVVRAGRWRRGSGESFKQTMFRHLPALTAGGAVERRKQGFVLPYDAWMRAALRDPAPRRLRDFAVRLRHPRYAGFVRRFTDRRLHWSRLWAIYVMDRFRESRIAA